MTFHIGDTLIANPDRRHIIESTILNWLDSGNCKIINLMNNGTLLQVTAPPEEGEDWQLSMLHCYMSDHIKNLNDLVVMAHGKV